MKYSIKTPDQMSGHNIDQLAHLAGIGFGQGDTPAMRQDTLDHVMASEQTQFVHEGGDLVAFAMTRECLWRPSR